MTRTIKVRDVKPGMEIEWTRNGLAYKARYERTADFGEALLKQYDWYVLHPQGRAPHCLEGDHGVVVLWDPQSGVTGLRLLPEAVPDVPMYIEDWPDGHDTHLRAYGWMSQMGQVWRCYDQKRGEWIGRYPYAQDALAGYARRPCQGPWMRVL